MRNKLDKKIFFSIFILTIGILSIITVHAKNNSTQIYIDSPYTNQLVDGKLHYQGWVMSEYSEASVKVYIDGEEGEKILEYYCDDIIYVLRIVYPVNGYKKRMQTKAFIKKVMSDGTEFELNPNGNIGSYKDALYSEFKLDANFVSLSKLSIKLSNFCSLISYIDNGLQTI